MIGIYMYENKLNHKKYIGQSTNIERRKREHLCWPSPYSRFDNELKVIGESGFDFSILEECDIDQLDEKEKYWINFYDSINTGYNLINGGQNYRGESNPAAKLKETEVKQIIILLEEHKLTNKQIAELFKVSRNTIDNINRCKTWQHLHNYTENIRQTNLNKLEHPHSAVAGVNNVSSTITEDEVISIINEIKHSNKTLAEIARKFNVKGSLVYDINRCRTWKYLHNYHKNIRNEYREKGGGYNDEGK